MAGLEALWFTLGLVGAFLSGSVPYSVIIGRLATGKDLRKYNIGNPGGFNAVMTYGVPIGLSVIFIDILKGFIPFMILDLVFTKVSEMGPGSIWYTLIMILGPVFCILGHNHSPWLGFKGGRGSAVFIGTLLWMNPIVLICFFLPFGFMIGLFKVPTRVSSFLSGIFFIPAALFMPITAPWATGIFEVIIFPVPGFLHMLPFFIALGMWLAWLPRLAPSLIAAIKGEEWTLKVGEGQKFSEKSDTKKENAREE
ncbi:MAG: glycerol-3-phosphate acyltransferase [Candidatus Heimdallarchaeota archaeon]